MLLNDSDLAKKLGVSRQQVYRMRMEGTITSSKVGKMNIYKSVKIHTDGGDVYDLDGNKLSSIYDNFDEDINRLGDEVRKG